MALKPSPPFKVNSQLRGNRNIIKLFSTLVAVWSAVLMISVNLIYNLTRRAFVDHLVGWELKAQSSPIKMLFIHFLSRDAFLVEG